jgi:hypothetical protein
MIEGKIFSCPWRMTALALYPSLAVRARNGRVAKRGQLRQILYVFFTKLEEE